MGYRLSENGFNDVLAALSTEYRLFSPKRYALEGGFSDTDSIRYGEIETAQELELSEKSSHTFKEALLPISETLFFFTEDSIKDPDSATKKTLIFLRSCDLHAAKRLDEIYLRGSIPDYYYERLRSNVKFVLLGCHTAFENCFCVDMGTNISDNYDASLDYKDGYYYLDCKDSYFDILLEKYAEESLDVTPTHVKNTSTNVSIPQNIPPMIMQSPIWDEYDSRCIACGRCNFSCPTCTCFTMQDIYYTDNGKVGERRRVWASCMVDGFTDVAGGGSYRKNNGQRMRFKILHKIWDYKKRYGYQMCVGCGRCDDVCPEYISFSNAINKLAAESQEENSND